MIVAAAAKILSTGDVVVGESRKDRHDAVFYKYNLEDKGFEFGFVDDTGRYLTRKEAAKHAYECGQLKKYVDGDIVMSEELW